MNTFIVPGTRLNLNMGSRNGLEMVQLPVYKKDKFDGWLEMDMAFHELRDGLKVRRNDAKGTVQFRPMHGYIVEITTKINP